MAHQVFLSHAKEDADAASRVCTLLEADGVGCWLASRDAMASEDKAATTLQAIRDSDLVLLIFSAWANASPTVLRDIERAIAYERPVLSIHLDDAVPSASLEYYLNLWQWLDASSGVEDKRDDIVAAVRGQLTGTSDSATWRPLDARGGVDSKREEILAVVRGHLALTPDSATSQELGAKATGRWRPSRRTWRIALAATLAALALGLGLGLGLTGRGHQDTWTKLYPAGTLPPARVVQAMVYDPSSGRLIMFGGSGDAALLNDTWSYDPTANTWNELKPSGTLPSARSGHSMAYDPTRGRLILFGGNDNIAPLNDTWAYDPTANTWNELKPSGPLPPARSGQSMASDPTSGRLIMFGGANGNASFNDTWAYDPVANAWTELKPSGPSPGERWGCAAAYDSSTGRLVVFGGEGPAGQFDDIWAYDPPANTWAELRPSGKSPASRTGASMVYDSSSHRVIIFGGCRIGNTEYFDDTWAFDPVVNAWTELEPSGALPSPRFFSPLVYAPSTGQVVMFGGGGPSAVFNDTWVFTP